MKEKIKYDPERLQARNPFLFDCDDGGRYRELLMVATNNFFLPVREDCVSLEV